VSIVDGKKAEIHSLCHKYAVREVYLFGSALRKDFGPRSDIDPGVVFSRNGVAGSFDPYFDFKSELERFRPDAARPVVGYPCDRQFVLGSWVGCGRLAGMKWSHSIEHDAPIQ
jgi:predicted nucleotidyltransferase